MNASSALRLSALDHIEYRVLRWVAPREPIHMSGEPYANKFKTKVLLGQEFLDQLRGKVVVDFGCGDGAEAVALAKHGASRVIGIDIRESILAIARARACAEGVADKCRFCTHADEPADAIISIDSFEHFAEPAVVLDKMHEMLRPGGAVYVSFGPTWYHPRGGHLFSVFPWAHVIFSENALLRWRSHLRTDGASHFAEVEGGLNQMTISRFEDILADSPFHAELLEAVPIRKLRVVHNRWTREFTTSIVRGKLVSKSNGRQP